MEIEPKEPSIICIPAIVRKAELPANTASAGILPRRLEVEASCEEEDSEGDVVLQRALLDASESFIAKGDIDLEHISKHGAEILSLLPSEFRFRAPEDYIIGRPVLVKGLDNGRTLVKAVISGGDGSRHLAADWFWKSLEAGETWQASIYGTITEATMSGPAKRLTVKAMDWTSLAMTRKPVNKSLLYSAKIVKARIESILSSLLGGELPIIKSDGAIFAEKASKEGYKYTNSIVPSDTFHSLGLPTVYELFEKWVQWRVMTGRYKDNDEKSARFFVISIAADYMYPALKPFVVDKTANNPLIDLYVYGMIGFREQTGKDALRRVNSGCIFGEVQNGDTKDSYTVSQQNK